jgi:hypothetical protein
VSVAARTLRPRVMNFPIHFEESFGVERRRS